MDPHPKCNNCSTLAEADHRIANHFAMLASYVLLKTAALARQPTEPTRDEMRLLLESIGVHIDAVANLHRILATDRSQAFTDLSQHLRNICNVFRSGPSYGFVIAEEFEAGCALPLDQLLPITQIFAEVITNAVKHAHTNGEAGPIRVSCRRQFGGTLIMEVIDEGSGLPKGVDPKANNGLGFRLVRTLSKQIGGLVEYQSSDKGLRFRLTPPPSSTPNLVERATLTTIRQRLSMFRTRRNGDANRKAAPSAF
jgi:two-component sensor histidine kinase